MTNSLSSPQQETVVVERHPAEIPLLILVILVSIAIWIMMVVSMIGIFYAVMIGAFLLLGHIGFISYLRGSAVRIGPDQFPELYSRVEILANRVGLNPVPEVYLMQAGGLLNALATKMFRAKIIVLYSDLLEACGDNTAARDMIIGHELGHIKAGHLRFFWFLLPGFFVPFLGSLYSQAREYTCDKYGAALCGNLSGALSGLTILSVGGKHGPQVNLKRFVKQSELLNTGTMTIGKWLSTHPPLCSRALALDPSLTDTPVSSTRGTLLALAMILTLLILSILGSVGVGVAMMKFNEIMKESIEKVNQNNLSQSGATKVVSDSQRARIQGDLNRIAVLIEQVKGATGSYPSSDTTTISKLWEIYRKGEREPIDPFDGQSYGYYTEVGSYIIWSIGPDRETSTDDDIYYSTF